MFKADKSAEFKQHKLTRLAEEHGLTVEELLEGATFDSVAPGICMNRGCDYTAEYEPDQREGWCEECQTRSVASALILAALI